MDPEGVREIFYGECGAAPDYGVRRAIATLPFPARQHDSFFFGVHLPLTRPLPKRLDVTLQQYVGLHAYDAIVLADIDPVVFDADDLINLQAYVEGGGGLLIIGGPHSLSRGQRNWGPLLEALPARPLLQPDKAIRLWNDPVPPQQTTPLPAALGPEHPVLCGISGPPGLVSHLQPLEVKPSATVLATAGDAPFIVAGRFGRGRAIIVSGYPGAAEPCFFRGRAWREILSQALIWLAGRDADLVFAHASLDEAPLAAGQSRRFSLQFQPGAAPPQQGQALIRQADPGWLAAGREPQFGPATTTPLNLSGHTAAFDFSATTPGLFQITLDISAAAWSAQRAIEIPVTSPLNLQLWVRAGHYVTAPGKSLALQCSAATPVTGTLRVLDLDDCPVLQLDNVALGAIDVAMPDVEPGEYQAILEAGGERACLRFLVAAPLERIGFSIVANGFHGATEERVQWWYDYFKSRGFNAFATGLPDMSPAPGPPQRFGATAFQQYLAQRDGLDLWGEYQHLTLLSTHAHYGAEGTKPTTPCLLDPAHQQQLRTLLAGKFAAAANVPRMTSLELIDEPHLMRANICRCERCLEQFQQRFGYAMPTWDQALAARNQSTSDYFEWAVDYAARAFALGYEIWKSFGPGPLVHHVLCALGSGNQSIDCAVAQDLPWVAHADFIEFDCYNYMYAHWRGSRQLPWNEFHYLMGHFRFLARRYRKRLGFFIQVTDRDVPVAPWDPLRAPSETLYSAIAGGAKTFHLMSKGSFSNKQNCREEKFDAFAADIRQVQRLAPLLDRAQRQPSRVAMVFPFHDRLYRFPARRLPAGYRGLGFYGVEARPLDTLWPYHKAPVNLSQLLMHGFGEVDVIDQRALRDGALGDYCGLLLAGVDYLHQADGQAIAAFVQRGGALLCDHLPSHDLAGRAAQPLHHLFADAQRQHLVHDVFTHTATAANAAGRALLIDSDLNELYTAAIENDEARLVLRLTALTRDFFFAAGIRPHALSCNPLIEAGLLRTDDTLVLVAVNHGETRQAGRITLFAPPLPVAHAIDLMTSAPLCWNSDAGALHLDVDLDERQGLIAGLFVAIPAELAITTDAPTARRGRDRLACTIALRDAAGRPVRGDHLLDVTVTDPTGNPRPHLSGVRCAVNGGFRFEHPLPSNARLGAWTVTACERFTTQLVRAQITVAN